MAEARGETVDILVFPCGDFEVGLAAGNLSTLVRLDCDELPSLFELAGFHGTQQSMACLQVNMPEGCAFRFAVDRPRRLIKKRLSEIQALNRLLGRLIKIRGLVGYCSEDGRPLTLLSPVELVRQVLKSESADLLRCARLPDGGDHGAAESRGEE